MAERPIAEDAFDKLRIAPDLTRALRAANRCAISALELTQNIRTCSSILSHLEMTSDKHINQLCIDGSQHVLELTLRCQALEAALEPLGNSYINVVQGSKRIGDINGTSYHEVVLNWSAYLCADIASLRWSSGRAPLVNENMRPSIAINWKSNVSRVARSPSLEAAVADIDRVLPMLVDEAVEVHRRRVAEKSSSVRKPVAKRKDHVRSAKSESIVSALVRHHEFDGTSCTNPTAITYRELKKDSGASYGVINKFFNREFNHDKKGGNAKYQVRCRDPASIADDLKALRGEYTPAGLSRMLKDTFQAGKGSSEG